MLVSKIIKIDGENVSIGTDDGKIREVKISDLNFEPTIGDEVDIFENNKSVIVSKKEKVQVKNSETSTTVVICGIVGVLFPIIGAILYYVFKNSDPKAAAMANKCSWIGFLLVVIYYIFFRASLFSLLGI